MRLSTGLIPATVISISLASIMTVMPVSAHEQLGKPLPSAIQQRTVTRSVPAHVKVPRFKVLRTNPYRKALIAEGVDTDIDDDNIAPGYRRRDLGRLEPSDELSEYVTVRLAVARAKAMEAYRKKWQT